MAIYERLKNMDLFYRDTTGNKFILNDLDDLSNSDTATIMNQLMTVYDDDVISVLPVCECGESEGAYLEGTVCPHCGTVVKDPQEQLESVMWMEKLDDDHVFMNPTYWKMLKQLLSTKVDFVRWLCDTSYNNIGDIPPYIIGAKEIIGGERDYVSFINNIDKVLIYWKNSSKFKKADKQDEIKILLNLYKNEKDRVFCSYLPIVNKKLFVMENTSKGKFTNLTVSDMLDLVMGWVKSVNSNLSRKRKSNTTATVLSKLSALYEVYTKDYLAQKSGIFRKHIYSARSHFTFRSVITSIAGPHKYTDIIVPWAVGVTVFRPHILNKLVKRGYKYKEADSLLLRSVNLYSDVISDILDELISDTKDGLKVILQRNPSLTQSSALMVNIGSFKKDVTDLTLSISTLIAKNMNADFDGDALNITIMGDDFMFEQFHTFEPHYNVADVTKPFGVSGNLGLLSSVTSIVSNYLANQGPDIPEEDTITMNLPKVSV